jgi:hypothetical protein
MHEFDLHVRHSVYDLTMREGAPPKTARIADAFHASEDDVAAALQRLADAHMLVLQRDSGEILMAGPFSAVPTAFRVRVNGIACYGNCIWDAMGIAAMLQADAEIDTSCADCGSAVHLFVRNGAIGGEDGFMHFPLPPRVWWEDVVFT